MRSCSSSSVAFILRIVVEPIDHLVAEQRVGDRHQCHALMMGHERANDGAVLPGFGRGRGARVRRIVSP